MRTSRKISEFTDELRGLIQRGAAGYTGTLPGRRELAARHGISVAGVQIAIKRLEAEGLVENFPRRGAQVRRAAAAACGPDVVRVSVFENLPHQTSFWLRCFAAFEAAHPGCQVRARFYDPNVESSVGDARIGLRAGRLATPRPAVPLAEALGAARAAGLRAAALPRLEGCDWNLALPYQLQFSAFVFAGDDESAKRLTAAAADGIEGWSRAVAALLGPGGAAEPPTPWLMDASGVCDVLDAAPERLGESAGLRRLCDALGVWAAAGLANRYVCAPEELVCPAIPGKVRGAVVHCHRWGAYDFGGACRAAPLPAGPGVALRVFVPSASIYGDESVTPGERAFLEYLASDDFQIEQMRAWAGLSPYAACLRAAGAGVPGMAALAADTLARPLRQAPCFLQPRLAGPLREAVVRPILAGALAPGDAPAVAVACLEAALASGPSRP